MLQGESAAEWAQIDNLSKIGCFSRQCQERNRNIHAVRGPRRGGAARRGSGTVERIRRRPMELTYLEAITDALRTALRDDERVLLLGQDRR